MTRKATSVVVGGLAALLLAVGGGAYYLWGDWSLTVRHHGPSAIETARLVSRSPAGVLPVAFVMKAAPRITRARGHAHDPIFGVSGHDTYKYDGAIAFEGHECLLRSQYHPVAMFKVGNRYFLLGRYWFNRELFEWRSSSGAEGFAEVAREEVPLPMKMVEFADPSLNRFFALWTLRESLSPTDEHAAVDLLAAFVRRNPRFAYQDHPTDHRDTTFCDILSVLRDDKRLRERDFFGPLTDVLRNSRPDDDPQEVGILALTLVTLRPEAGHKVVRDFIDSVRAAHLPGDDRLSDLEWRIKAHDDELRVQRPQSVPAQERK